MRIGFLGVGNMGQPMAGKLIDAGHELWVYDVSDAAMQPLLERQARRAESPQDLADSCETVIVSLPTLDIFRRAVIREGGLLSGQTIKTLVNTCTVGGVFTKEVEAACTAKGVALVDAPISGGVAGAKAGTLTTMISGDPEKLDALHSVFTAWGPTVVNAGDRPGAAQSMKLTNNILFAVSLAAAAEAMTMANKSGIDPDAMLRVLNNGTGRNFVTMNVYAAEMQSRNFDFGATMEILNKDIDLAIQQGESLGIPMWVCQAARHVFKHAAFKGGAEQDLSRIVEFIEDGTRQS